MANERWLSIRLELLSGRDLVLEHPPARVMIAGPRHTLAELAEAIDLAFARWDRSHLHQFTLADGRDTCPARASFSQRCWTAPAPGSTLLAFVPNAEFEYVFDLGDEWRHHCRVEATDIDPVKEYGAQPKLPVPIWGWGWIPDQYGRTKADE